MDGGLGAEGGFFGSNRLKSTAGLPFVGLSANIVSLATNVEAVDFLGQVPYHELLDLSCFSTLVSVEKSR